MSEMLSNLDDAGSLKPATATHTHTHTIRAPPHHTNTLNTKSTQNHSQQESKQARHAARPRCDSLYAREPRRLSPPGLFKQHHGFFVLVLVSFPHRYSQHQHPQCLCRPIPQGTESVPCAGTQCPGFRCPATGLPRRGLCYDSQYGPPGPFASDANAALLAYPSCKGRGNCLAVFAYPTERGDWECERGVGLIPGRVF